MANVNITNNTQLKVGDLMLDTSDNEVFFLTKTILYSLSTGLHYFSDCSTFATLLKLIGQDKDLVRFQGQVTLRNE